MSKKARRRPSWKRSARNFRSRKFDRLLKEAGEKLFREHGILNDI